MALSKFVNQRTTIQPRIKTKEGRVTIAYQVVHKGENLSSNRQNSSPPQEQFEGCFKSQNEFLLMYFLYAQTTKMDFLLQATCQACFLRAHEAISRIEVRPRPPFSSGEQILAQATVFKRLLLPSKEP